MPDNQWLTVQDVYNPIATAQAVENITDAKIRNRINAMKMREAMQQQARRDKWNAAYNNPGGQFNPLTGQNAQPPAPQPNQMQPQDQPGPSNAPNLAGNAPNLTVQGSGGHGQPPTQPQPPQQPILTDEDKAALRGQKRLAAMSASVQPLINAAKNDPAQSAIINKQAEMLNNDPDYKAYIAKQGYDELSYHHDAETGMGEYTITRNWDKDTLEAYGSKAPNGQVLTDLAKHPGKYQIKFDDMGAVTDVQFINTTALGKKTHEELIDLSLHGTPQEKKLALENLAAEAKFKKDTSAAGTTETGFTRDAIEMEAERVVAGEKVGNYGYGRQGALMRATVLNRAAAIAKSRGMDASDIIAQGAELAGEKGGMRDLVKRESLMGSYVKRIDATSDLVMKFAKEIGNTDSRLLNIPRNQLVKFIGSGKYRAYELSLFSLSREIAKVETGQLGISAVTDSQAKIMDAIHDPNLSLKDLQDLINGGKALGKTAMDSIRRQRKDLKSEISGHTDQPEPSGDDPLGLR